MWDLFLSQYFSKFILIYSVLNHIITRLINAWIIMDNLSSIWIIFNIQFYYYYLQYLIFNMDYLQYLI